MSARRGCPRTGIKTRGSVSRADSRLTRCVLQVCTWLSHFCPPFVSPYVIPSSITISPLANMYLNYPVNAFLIPVNEIRRLEAHPLCFTGPGDPLPLPHTPHTHLHEPVYPSRCVLLVVDLNISLLSAVGAVGDSPVCVLGAIPGVGNGELSPPYNSLLYSYCGKSCGSI